MCWYRPLAAFVMFTLTLVAVQSAESAQPRWSPNIIVTGQAREQLRSLPIEQRPNRPLHLYGNTVRRMHHRSTAAAPLGVGASLPAPAR